jgi:hypothetical protein
MKWKQERDLLIAQTMAFVQSVAGQSAFAVTPAEPPAARGPANVPSPREVIASRPLVPIKHSDLREEIQRRVAAFRARQQLFERDRDEYCNATLARARASTEQAAKLSERRPIKR